MWNGDRGGVARAAERSCEAGERAGAKAREAAGGDAEAMRGMSAADEDERRLDIEIQALFGPLRHAPPSFFEIEGRGDALAGITDEVVDMLFERRR